MKRKGPPISAFCGGVDDVQIPPVKRSRPANVAEVQPPEDLQGAPDIPGIKGRHGMFTSCAGCNTFRHNACIETSRVVAHHDEDARWQKCVPCGVMLCSDQCTKAHRCRCPDPSFEAVDGSAYMEISRNGPFPHVHCLLEEDNQLVRVDRVSLDKLCTDPGGPSRHFIIDSKCIRASRPKAKKSGKKGEHCQYCDRTPRHIHELKDVEESTTRAAEEVCHNHAFRV